MPKSFVSSLFAPSRRRPPAESTRSHRASGRLVLGAIGLLALSALVAGCGGAREPHYTADQVREALAAEGISVFDRNQAIPQFSPLRARAPRPRPERVTEPLTALLNGVRAAVLGPTAHPQLHPTTLAGFQLSVFIYPSEQGARRKVADLTDTLDALEILHRVNLGFKQKGNVVVSYRVYRYGYQRGIPGFPDAQERIEAYDGNRPGSVAAALARLP